MNPIVSKLVSAALSAAGIAVCGILTDVIKEGVSDICVLLPYPYPVNAKVYVIDDDTHCTMLLAEEY